MTHSLVLKVPESIYQPIVEEARAKRRKVEEIALERLAVKKPQLEKKSIQIHRLW